MSNTRINVEVLGEDAQIEVEGETIDIFLGLAMTIDHITKELKVRHEWALDLLTDLLEQINAYEQQQ